MPELLDSVVNTISGSPWTYLLIALVCAGDAVFPLLPSETIVVAAAVLAANGKLEILPIALVAAAGAFLGDNTAYGLGNSGLRRLARHFTRSEKSRRRFEWSREQLELRGAWIILVARFIPGGRTATTYLAGTLEMPWRRRFVPADAAAVVLWSAYCTALGYFGGAAFENNLWLPLIIAAAVSVVVAGGGELVRRRLGSRSANNREKVPPRE